MRDIAPAPPAFRGHLDQTRDRARPFSVRGKVRGDERPITPTTTITVQAASFTAGLRGERVTSFRPDVACLPRMSSQIACKS